MEVEGEFQPISKQPEEILPLVVWTLIFDTFDSPIDLATCFRTCSTWRKLLESKRKLFLMPEVFPFVHKYLLEKKTESDAEDVAANGDRSTRPGNPCLNTRITCRFWKISIDFYFQDASHHTNLGSSPETLQIYSNRTLNPYKFIGVVPLYLESFLSKGFDPSGNPFVTRYIEYWPHLGWHNSRGLESLLELFGEQVWYSKLCFVYDREIPFNANIFYNLFHRLLSLMPNLKTLSVRFFVDGASFTGTTATLRKLLRDKPLPKLEHLTTLYMSGVPVPIEKGMLLANPVKQLTLRSGLGGSPISSGEIPEYLNNMEMHHLEELELWANVTIEKDLHALKCFSVPIQNLRIDCSTMELDKVFKELSKARFAPELKDLGVHALYDQCLSVDFEEKLDLPQLNSFHITVAAPIRNIDFLLPSHQSLFKLDFIIHSVKQLQLTPQTFSCEQKGNAPKIQFLGYGSSMLQSNIWKLFPVLQSIKISCPRETNGESTFRYWKFTRRPFQKNCQKITPSQCSVK